VTTPQQIQFEFGNLQNPVPQIAQAEWESRARIHLVHGKEIVLVTESGKAYGQADGAITSVPGVWLSVSFADCVPILLARMDGKKVAALHAGWRGTIQEIASNFCRTLKNTGDDPAQWQAWIGPSIRECCYEVGTEVYESFQKRFLLQPNKNRLDLATLNERLLREGGIQEVQLHAPCTCCTVDSTSVDSTNPHQETNPQNFTYFSYRRDKTKSRQWAAIQVVL